MKKYLRQITRIQWITLLSFIAYFFWEFYFQPNWKPDKEGSFRIDLLVMYPFLILLGIVSFVHLFRQSRMLASLVLGFVLGAATIAFILGSQVQNRYNMGYRTGYTSGGLDMARFMQSHLTGNDSLSKPYCIKYVSIKPVVKNNEKTFVITGLQHEN